MSVAVLITGVPRVVRRTARDHLRKATPMDGSALHTTAADCAQELPAAELEQPFGPDWEMFKVRGKVFMLMTEVPGRPVVILKAEPGEVRALQEHNSHITPGYHMNKEALDHPGGRAGRRCEARERTGHRLLPARGRPAAPGSAARRPAQLRQGRIRARRPPRGSENPARQRRPAAMNHDLTAGTRFLARGPLHSFIELPVLLTR